MDKNSFTFTHTWVIENFSSCVTKAGEILASPVFKLDEHEAEEWCLNLYPRGEGCSLDYIGFYLRRNSAGKKEGISIRYKFEMLSYNGSVSKSCGILESLFAKETGNGLSRFVLQNEIYCDKRNYVLRDDCLNLKVEIWKTNGELQIPKQSIARTRLYKEVISSIITVEKFSAITSETKKTIFLTEKNKKISVNISASGSLSRGESLDFEVSVNNPCEYKLLIASFSFLSHRNGKLEIMPHEIWLDSLEGGKSWKLPCIIPKEILLKEGFVNDDTLRIFIKFLACKGVAHESREFFISEPSCQRSESLEMSTINEQQNTVLNDLSHDLKFVYLDGLLSDVSLRTDSQSFNVHRAHLSARSPVFKAMFTSDMKESSESIVQIKDIDGDTLKRMLHFFYTDSIGDLDVESAKKLYFAADKYQVQLLKHMCCEYLLKHVSLTNMCDFLLLADMHQHSEFKSSVMFFMVDNCNEVLHTDTWKSFMRSHSSLASEAMYKMLAKSSISKIK